MYGGRRSGNSNHDARELASPTILCTAVIGCGLLGARISLELASGGVREVRVFDRGMQPEDVALKIAELEEE